MGNRIIVILAVCLLYAFRIYAQTDTSLLARMENEWFPGTDFSGAGTINPAARVFSDRLSLHRINMAGTNRTGNADLLQMGSQGRHSSVSATSFIDQNPRFIWGDAAYAKGVKDNVAGNETSDFEIVYPYVMMDSIGRDHLNYEEYTFSGGYARKEKRLSWGVELDYRALMEYRVRDPRPDNVSGDLSLRAGANYRLWPHYAVGGGLRLRTYKQRNTLTFFNPLGAYKVYHYTGLGSNAYMFAGNNMRTRFKGSAQSLNLQLLPLSGDGISATFLYDYFSFEKTMPDYQNLPTSRAHEESLTTTISFLSKDGNRTLGFKILSEAKNRRGIENKFHSPQYGNYEKISEEELFSNHTFHHRLEFLYGKHRSTTLKWHITPYLSLTGMDQRYLSPARRMKILRVNAATGWGFTHTSARSAWYFSGEHAYTRCLQSSLTADGLPDESFAGCLLRENYAYLSSGGFQNRLSLQYNYHVKTNTAIQLSLSWYSRLSGNYSGNEQTVNIGICF